MFRLFRCARDAGCTNWTPLLSNEEEKVFNSDSGLQQATYTDPKVENLDQISWPTYLDSPVCRVKVGRCVGEREVGIL